ncbi:type IV toxin-antitoxin system AbiEi family antitoxin domain-containing protein [Microbacterium aoyamense]|uniref:Type IV toxin-antitoxin system AbiEi family antitoxin domain-containing protein n=1 Tax=Microbacterium aoyamense TaxID=344166 RepID=A0ABN2Q171_9MICO|nr:type IV toxin-antitoxin system AbiEi family antitoxin domain-containing protein [Microbacterium aoyamense]
MSQNVEPRFFRTGDLHERGWTDRDLRRAVASGILLKLRDGAYAGSEVDAACLSAGRMGARLTCLTELGRLGIFVLESEGIHVQVAPNHSRPLRKPARTRVHWTRQLRRAHPRSLTTTVFDALVLAVSCQPVRASVATLDSALRSGLLREDDLDELFARIPQRYAVLRRLIDPRAESGPESLMRLILRGLRCRFEPQVWIAGVGRVDFLVDGWLIVECDSRAHHWETRRQDLKRDQEAAARGYVTFRPLAEDIMWRPGEVRAALLGLLRVGRPAVRGRKA